MAKKLTKKEIVSEVTDRLLGQGKYHPLVQDALSRMRDARMYNRALSAKEVLRLWKASRKQW